MPTPGLSPDAARSHTRRRGVTLRSRCTGPLEHEAARRREARRRVEHRRDLLVGEHHERRDRDRRRDAHRWLVLELRQRDEAERGHVEDGREALERPSGPRARRRIVGLDVANVRDGLEDAVDAVRGGVVTEDRLLVRLEGGEEGLDRLHVVELVRLEQVELEAVADEGVLQHRQLEDDPRRHAGEAGRRDAGVVELEDCALHCSRRSGAVVGSRDSGAPRKQIYASYQVASRARARKHASAKRRESKRSGYN